MTCTGISSTDFTDILSDLGVTVSYKVMTKTTDNMTGTETTTFATASNKTVIFFLEENRFVWDKSGLLEVGDCYLICATSLSAKRYDQFTYNGKTYYVDNVVRRELAGNLFHDYCTCFLVD